MKKILLLHYVMLWMGQIGIVLDQSPNWKSTHATGNKLVICIINKSYHHLHHVHTVVFSSNNFLYSSLSWASLVNDPQVWCMAFISFLTVFLRDLGLPLCPPPLSLSLLPSGTKCIANLVVDMIYFQSPCSIYLHWHFVMMESMSSSWHLPSS